MKSIAKSKNKTKKRAVKPPVARWNIYFSQKDRSLRIDLRRLKSLLVALLDEVAAEHTNIPAREISILFTGNDSIQEMNRTFRGKDKPTDVLSFAQYDGSAHWLPPTLGDLVLSLPITVSQAKRYGWSVSDELLRLLIHGILHLYGYDHEGVAKSDAQRMRRYERRLFGKYRANSLGITKKARATPKK